MSKNIAVVTGTTGFLGKKITHTLLEADFEVRSISRQWDQFKRQNISNKAIKLFGTSDSEIESATKDVNYFFNGAVIYDRPEFSDELINDVNVELPLRIIKTLTNQVNDVTCILGDTFFRKFPPNATRQIRYTESKNRLQKELARLTLNDSIRIAMLQIEQMYGPNDNPSKVIPRLTRQMLDNIDRIALTAGVQQRDFIYIDDVANAAKKIFSSQDWEGRIVVECGTGKSIQVKEVFKTIHKLSNSKSILGYGDLKEDQDIERSEANNLWLINRGWEPQVTLDKGLKKLVEAAKAIRHNNERCKK